MNKMSVKFHSSQETQMTVEDSKIGYKRLFMDTSGILQSVYALRTNRLKVAAICLGLLTVLLMAVVIGQGVHSHHVSQDNLKNLNEVNEKKSRLEDELKTVKKQNKDLESFRMSLRDEISSLKRSNMEAHTAYVKVRDDKSNLEVSKSQLQATNTALIKQVQVLNRTNDQLQKDKNTVRLTQIQYQNLYESTLKSKNELKANYDSLHTERNNLENQVNNVTRSRNQLQQNYNDLVKKVEELHDRYNFSASEKDKLAGKHLNLTTQNKLLQDLYDALKKSENDLQATYSSVLSEKTQLEVRLKNVTQERDQLQEEFNKLNATIQGKQCPPGWVKFQYSCYFTSSAKKTWKKGREDCRNKNADLAIINSKEEMSFINALYNTEKEVWIGLTDDGVEGQWKWVDTTPLTLSFWAKGQPNSHQGRNQDCVEIWHRASGTGDWNDENCAIEQYYICEL